MTSSENDTTSEPVEPVDPLRCSACSSRLAHDQRYCVECGQRRGPLPSPVSEMLGAMLESGQTPEPATPPEPADGPRRSPESRLPFGLTLPGPRAGAVGVIGMLAFGVIVSYTIAPPVQSLVASAPTLIAVGGGHGTAGGTAGAGANGSAGGGGGGGTITEVITQVTTTPSPSSSTGDSTGTGDDTGDGTGDDSGTTGTGSGTGSATNTASLLGLPPIKHVFVIMLSDEGFNQTFAPASADKYLSKTLPAEGELIEDYYAVAGSELANGIALISGQGPTQDTTADCPNFTAIKSTTTKGRGEVIGNGCVYPTKTQTVAGQLTQAGDTWTAYIDGMTKTPKSKQAACEHPALGSSDPDHIARAGHPYVTWRNPFVYFASLTGGTDCQTGDVPLSKLTGDLKDADTAPALSYIVPSPCEDGSDTPCAPNAPAGLAPADKFLQKVVPEIKRSAAYKDRGLIVITSDEAPQTGADADPAACCGNPKYPNLPAQTAAAPTTTTTPATTTPAPSLGTTGSASPTGGGGQVGMVMISSYIKPGTIDLIDYYNHYSLLALVENLFGLKHLGYAGNPSLPAFDASIFTGKGPPSS